MPTGGPAIGRVLSRAWLRGDAVLLAPQLLGRVIVSDSPQGRVAVRITEVEAYRGDDDPASHAYRGPTGRNAVMFGEPGHLYTYFVYGMHWCANVVTGPVGVPSAVLLRAGEVISGIELAQTRRTAGTRLEHLGRGPAGLASVLALRAEQNGVDLCVASCAVTLRTGDVISQSQVSSGPRVGVSTGTHRPWRFWVTGSPSVSAYRAGVPRRR